MKMKRALAWLLAGTMAAGLMGCGGSTDSKSTGSNSTESKSTEAAKDGTKNETQAAASGDQITLRMAWWGSQSRHDATNKVIEMYEEQNPNVKIEAEFYDFDSYFTKLDTLVAADDVWDIFQLGGNFPKYENNIEMLGSYMDQGTIDVSDTTESFLKTTQNNN